MSLAHLTAPSLHGERDACMAPLINSRRVFASVVKALTYALVHTSILTTSFALRPRTHRTSFAMSLHGGDAHTMRDYGGSSEATLIDSDTTASGSESGNSCKDAGRFRLEWELTHVTTKIYKLEAEVTKVLSQRDDLTKRCRELKDQVVEVYNERSAANAHPRDATSIPTSSDLGHSPSILTLLARAMQEKEAALAREQAARLEAHETKQETARFKEELRISQERNANPDTDLQAARNVDTSHEESVLRQLRDRYFKLEAGKLDLNHQNKRLAKELRDNLKKVSEFRSELTFLKSRNANRNAEMEEIRRKLAIAEERHARYVQMWIPQVIVHLLAMSTIILHYSNSFRFPIAQVHQTRSNK